MSELTRDDWTSWRNHPVSKIWRELLQREAEDMQVTMYHPDSVEKTALACAHLTGVIEGIELALGIEPEFMDDEATGAY